MTAIRYSMIKFIPLLAAILICTSCTSLLMDSGKRPWKSRGIDRDSAHRQYGKPTQSGIWDDRLWAALESEGYRPQTNTLSFFELYQIRGPFPEPDETKSLEALYISAFTLGLAEIVMLPPTAIGKICQHWQRRPFLFLYNNDDIAVSIGSVSTNIIDSLNSHADE